MPKHCIDCKDYEGIRIIFSEDQRKEKMLKHPELRGDAFITRIQNALEHPSFIYEDLAETKRCAYYVREYGINSKIVYTKVIVQKGTQSGFVITAYRPDYVKERGKSRLIFGEDND
jgi:hypothetical protein